MPELDTKAIFVDLLDSPAPPLPTRADVITGARGALRRRRASLAVCGVGLVTLAVVAGVSLIPALGGSSGPIVGGPIVGSSAVNSPGPTPSTRQVKRASPTVTLSPSIRSRPKGADVPPAQRQRLDALLAALEAKVPAGFTAPAGDLPPVGIRSTTVEGWQATGWHYSVDTTATGRGAATVLTVDAFSGFGALAAGCTGTENLAGQVSGDTCREYTASDGSSVGVISRGSELHAAWGNGDIAVSIRQIAVRGTAGDMPFTPQQLADLVVDPLLRP